MASSEAHQDSEVVEAAAGVIVRGDDLDAEDGAVEQAGAAGMDSAETEPEEAEGSASSSAAPAAAEVETHRENGIVVLNDAPKSRLGRSAAWAARRVEGVSGGVIGADVAVLSGLPWGAKTTDVVEFLAPLMPVGFKTDGQAVEGLFMTYNSA